jgi:fructose-1,6-bisphosphatase/inositol monophosphatase family enzyme
VHHSPDQLRQLSLTGSVWLVDPIDGTRNFVAGTDAFGIAVALVEQGETQAAWIALPARKQRFVAERAAGAYLNGEQLRRRTSTDSSLQGTVYTRFMPRGIAQNVERSLAGKYDPKPAVGCSAVEYATRSATPIS